ncbi:hypothetical protein O181_095877 [Austropuccinia psidii MF-1]|uniref:Uncharacterized protein n=1 Tax=Austropuccinia psidii MF-1 TaxID=1389203 RepID=A0A9Q3PCZ9_9BASI|nr:hypothetical protein [Austropuccinia psidii MF-1]
MWRFFTDKHNRQPRSRCGKRFNKPQRSNNQNKLSDTFAIWSTKLLRPIVQHECRNLMPRLKFHEQHEYKHAKHPLTVNSDTPAKPRSRDEERQMLMREREEERRLHEMQIRAEEQRRNDQMNMYMMAMLSKMMGVPLDDPSADLRMGE